MRFLLVLPAVALLTACGTQPSTFSDGYVSADFFTDRANHVRGQVVQPGEYEAASPSKRGCTWTLTDLKGEARRTFGHNETRSVIVLGENAWLHSSGCGEWKPTRTESSYDDPR